MNQNLALYIVVALFLLLVGLTLKQIFSRLNNNESNLTKFKKEVNGELGKIHDTITAEYRELQKAMTFNKQEILATLTATKNDSVSKTVCKLTQALHDEKFNSMMERFDKYLKQDEKDHTSIIGTMNRISKEASKQRDSFSAQLNDLSECLHKLQLNKEC